MAKKKATIKLETLKLNPKNPSITIDEKFHKLVRSITEFSKMMSMREIVVDENNIALGGNKRLTAIREIVSLVKDDEKVFQDEPKLREILLKDEIPSSWIKVVTGLTEKQKKEFAVKDNVSFGVFDWEMMSESDDWDLDEVSEWGADVPDYSVKDYSDQNSEIDLDDIDGTMKITLEYTFDEYQIVKEKLAEIASTPEQAVYQLLKIDSDE